LEIDRDVPGAGVAEQFDGVAEIFDGRAVDRFDEGRRRG